MQNTGSVTNNPPKKSTSSTNAFDDATKNAKDAVVYTALITGTNNKVEFIKKTDGSIAIKPNFKMTFEQGQALVSGILNSRDGTNFSNLTGIILVPNFYDFKRTILDVEEIAADSSFTIKNAEKKQTTQKEMAPVTYGGGGSGAPYTYSWSMPDTPETEAARLNALQPGSYATTLSGPGSSEKYEVHPVTKEVYKGSVARKEIDTRVEAQRKIERKIQEIKKTSIEMADYFKGLSPDDKQKFVREMDVLDQDPAFLPKKDTFASYDRQSLYRKSTDPVIEKARYFHGLFQYYQLREIQEASDARYELYFKGGLTIVAGGVTFLFGLLTSEVGIGLVSIGIGLETMSKGYQMLNEGENYDGGSLLSDGLVSMGMPKDYAQATSNIAVGVGTIYTGTALINAPSTLSKVVGTDMAVRGTTQLVNGAAGTNYEAPQDQLVGYVVGENGKLIFQGIMTTVALRQVAKGGVQEGSVADRTGKAISNADKALKSGQYGAPLGAEPIQPVIMVEGANGNSYQVTPGSNGAPQARQSQPGTLTGQPTAVGPTIKVNPGGFFAEKTTVKQFTGRQLNDPENAASFVPYADQRTTYVGYNKKDQLGREQFELDFPNQDNLAYFIVEYPPQGATPIRNNYTLANGNTVIGGTRLIIADLPNNTFTKFCRFITGDGNADRVTVQNTYRSIMGEQALRGGFAEITAVVADLEYAGGLGAGKISQKSAALYAKERGIENVTGTYTKDNYGVAISALQEAGYKVVVFVDKMTITTGFKYNNPDGSPANQPIVKIIATTNESTYNFMMREGSLSSTAIDGSAYATHGGQFMTAMVNNAKSVNPQLEPTASGTYYQYEYNFPGHGPVKVKVDVESISAKQEMGVKKD